MKDLGGTFAVILALSFAIETVLSRVRSGPASSRSHERIGWAVSVVATYVLCNLAKLSIFNTPDELPLGRVQLGYLLTALVAAAGADHIAAFREKLIADTKVAEKEMAEREAAEKKAKERGADSGDITIDGTLVLDEETRKLLIKAIARE